MKKRTKYLLLVLLFTFCISIFYFIEGKKGKGNDYKIGILADDGLSLVSISKDRKMINVLKIDSEVKIWIPKGLSWYRNSTIKSVLEQENKIELLDDIFFYNFGYKADKLLVLKKTDDWKNAFWFKLIFYNNYLTKEEFLKNNVNQSDDFLDEVMVRDFAETKIIEEELKLSIINTTEVGGLASFMAKRFERLGFWVTYLGNDSSEKVKECHIFYGKEASNSFSFSLIKKIIKCESSEDLTLNVNEIEIYFDSNFSRMIEYPSYNIN